MRRLISCFRGLLLNRQEKSNLWKKKINLTDSRALSHEFCESFGLSYCEIYHVDRIEKAYGSYIYLTPPHILILVAPFVTNRIGILMHELTHHLEHQEYSDREGYSQKDMHGYFYQLAKRRVIKWCELNISNKPDWGIPLKGTQSIQGMAEFRL